MALFWLYPQPIQKRYVRIIKNIPHKSVVYTHAIFKIGCIKGGVRYLLPYLSFYVFDDIFYTVCVQLFTNNEKVDSRVPVLNKDSRGNKNLESTD